MIVHKNIMYYWDLYSTRAIPRFAGLLAITLLLSCGSNLPPEIELAQAALPDKVDFNFHIRPILSDRCYACHGPDEETRASGLRFDVEDSAFGSLADSGERAIVAGNLKKSVMWQRILSEDPERQMPPPESKLKLTDQEKALLAKWIEDGAEWKAHWAFIPPKDPEIPQGFPHDWVVENPIDNFIYAQLPQNDLEPSVTADRERLIRRVSFDLRGLPPGLDEIDAFIQDKSADAYEQMIDRFMQTDAYAERMAMEWLDVARFADSHGLHADGMREMWPWRDWVIKAFKNNYSYDQFVTWQLAGDLLPEATAEQKLATGFHRNHTFNTELGIVSEEFRLQYVGDRTNTTATAFLGLTMECAACHDHKFDPISQKEYYQMTAFFNNVNELGMTGTDQNFGPMVLLPNPEIAEQIAEIEGRIDSLEHEVQLNQEQIADIDQFTEFSAPRADHHFPLDRVSKPKTDAISESLPIDGNAKAVVFGGHEEEPGKVGGAIRIAHDFDGIRFSGVRNFEMYEPLSAGCWIKTEKTGKFQSIIGNIGEKNTSWRGWVVYLDTLNRITARIVHALPHNLIEVFVDEIIPTEEWHHIFFTHDGSAKAEGVKLFLNGRQLKTHVVRDNLYKTILPTKNRDYTLYDDKPLALGNGVKYLYTDVDDGIYEGFFDQVRIFSRDVSALEILLLHQQDTQEEQSDFAPTLKKEHYLKSQDKINLKLQTELLAARREKLHLVDPVQESMVMQEMQTPRPTFVRNRGQYDDPTEQVFASTPEAIQSLPDYLPPNRLGLAQWLFTPDHPLTARVTVNRYWQVIFGTGLVSTPHDFGSQGALPSHPDLLDWLALEFVESGWDVRQLLKTMLMSHTYRQSSEVTKQHAQRDPINRYLARSPSYRLQGEMIRDNALCASGLLSNEVGGESVKPYQPSGLWKEKNEFSGYLNDYVADTGQDLYRRSMYTFIRRTSPPPAMTAFDQPDRSVCTVKREKTSSPLQSLVMLNDPQFVEASRVLSERMQKEGGALLAERINYGFRLACGRFPTEGEISLLEEQYAASREKFAADGHAADEILSMGEYPADRQLPKVETAALAMVANTMLNFDEAYMKR